MLATANEKSLDQKLAAIHADPSGARDFIIADAKDADMAFGIGAHRAIRPSRTRASSSFARWASIASRSGRSSGKAKSTSC